MPISIGGPYVKWVPRGGGGEGGGGQGKNIINSVGRNIGQIEMALGYIIPSVFSNIQFFFRPLSISVRVQSNFDHFENILNSKGT